MSDPPARPRRTWRKPALALAKCGLAALLLTWLVRSGRLNFESLVQLRLGWVTVGLVLGVIYYARATPIYQSAAKVLVVKKTPDALPMSPGGEMRPTYQSEDYLSTHQTLIRSPVIVGEAVRQAQLGSLPSFAGRVSPDQAQALVAYVRAFGPEPTRADEVPASDFEKRFREMQAEWEELQRQMRELQKPAKP